MSIIRDGRCPITLDKERKIIFDLNVLDEVNDKFGGLNDLGEKLSGKEGPRNMRWLATVMLNEAIEENETPLTEKQVGRMIHSGNLAYVKTAIFRCIAVGNVGEDAAKETEESEEENEGNAAAGQVK